jgi:hypothetical protein
LKVSLPPNVLVNLKNPSCTETCLIYLNKVLNAWIQFTVDCIPQTVVPEGDVRRPQASQQILRNFCNPDIHYRVHKIPPFNPTMCQMNPVHNLTTNLFKIILFNIIFPLTIWSRKLSVSFEFPREMLHACFSFACYMQLQVLIPCPRSPIDFV